VRVVANTKFEHSASLRGFFGSEDPRKSLFNHREVEIDLRNCQFVRPAAVLWCVVFPLLVRARQIPCRLLVPESFEVCRYLKSLGLFQLLKENEVEVDDRGVDHREDPQLVVPMTRFDTEFDVENVTNDADEALGRFGGPVTLHAVVTNTFAELALNAVQHSESPLGAYGFIQFYDSPRGRRFVCGVADGGIGVRNSLEKNPEHGRRVYYDWDALELALRERVSGTLEPTRGWVYSA
jgi:hypothetical protein